MRRFRDWISDIDRGGMILYVLIFYAIVVPLAIKAGPTVAHIWNPGP